MDNVFSTFFISNSSDLIIKYKENEGVFKCILGNKCWMFLQMMVKGRNLSVGFSSDHIKRQKS